MTRPLRYDDQFISIINDKFHESFLKIITLKVQSTAFFKRLNLQQSLQLCGLIDFFIGLIVFLYFFKLLQLKEEGILYAIENITLIISMFFGLLGFDSATNLKKYNGNIYKLWRIYFTFSIPVIELFQQIEGFCYYYYQCSFLFYILATTLYLIINLYLTKIAWSFCIRLDKGHELLIIHGKYLEKMMAEENYKINDVKQYIPPELRDKNIRNVHKENELINLGNAQSNVIEEDAFAPSKNNPFFNAMKNIQMKK